MLMTAYKKKHTHTLQYPATMCTTLTVSVEDDYLDAQRVSAGRLEDQITVRTLAA